MSMFSVAFLNKNNRNKKHHLPDPLANDALVSDEMIIKQNYELSKRIYISHCPIY